MIKGRVTAVVASYNHAGYLVQRMESLIHQTWEDLEILVIDDCSTDNSRDVLRPYSNDPRVKLIENTKNSGWVKVSNQGLEMATGEFIIFENCDDFCEITQIEKMVSALQENPSAGASFCKSLMVDEFGVPYGDDFEVREESFKEHTKKSGFFTGLEMSKFLLHSCVLPNLSAVMFRKDVIANAGGFSSEFLVCSDWDLFLKIAQTKDFVYLTEALNSFRQHRATIRKSTKECIVYDEYFKLISRFIKKIKLTSLERITYYLWIGRLWTKHLLSKNGHGFKNLGYHMKHNIAYSVWIVLLLPIAILIEVPSAIFRATSKKLLAGQ